MTRTTQNNIRRTILEQTEKFTVPDIIKAVNSELGGDHSLDCCKTLDQLLETPLVRYVGQNKTGNSVYSAL